MRYQLEDIAKKIQRLEDTDFLAARLTEILIEMLDFIDQALPLDKSDEV